MQTKVGYRFRFYPTKEQEHILAHTFGCTRFAYNWFLSCRSDCYSKTGIDFNYNTASKWWTIIKGFENRKWLNDVSSVPEQQALMHCDRAFKKFFKGESKYPTFHKLHNEQSATYVASAFKCDPVKHSLYVSGLGNLSKIKWHRNFSNRVSSMTITKSTTNKYYISFLTTEERSSLPKTGQKVGIDMGLRDLMIFSDGTKIENPRFLKKSLKNLSHLQREMSKKKKGSKRREKARIKLARANEKVTRCRLDLAHKITINIVRLFDLIKTENLNVVGMIKNHKLAQAISDVGWSLIKRLLLYKCDWYGKELQEIDRWFPSSKMCNVCKHVNHNLTLEDEFWVCPQCGAELNRDINAAINILNAVGHTVNGRGGKVRLSGKRAESKLSRRSVNQLVPETT